MTGKWVATAQLPPAGLPGLDPAWSRLVSARDGDGVTRTWHVLDSHASAPDAPVELTLLCVHGNPTWSYLWRRLVAAAPAGVRVVAVDQLDMGYSERTGTVRRLAQRIEDLGCIAAELGVTGPVVTVAHDWGGPISLGWALRHRDRAAGHRPAQHRRAPAGRLAGPRRHPAGPIRAAARGEHRFDTGLRPGDDPAQRAAPAARRRRCLRCPVRQQ